jgi:hypothetical protein
MQTGLSPQASSFGLEHFGIDDSPSLMLQIAPLLLDAHSVGCIVPDLLVFVCSLRALSMTQTKPATHADPYCSKQS